MPERRGRPAKPSRGLASPASRHSSFSARWTSSSNNAGVVFVENLLEILSTDLFGARPASGPGEG